MDALGTLGSDLAFAVSFNIATELLAGAKEGGVNEDELVGFVLATTLLFAGLDRLVKLVDTELQSRGWLGKHSDGRGLLDFFGLLLSIARRISMATSAQLLAANSRAMQPLRTARVLSLLSVFAFFVFVEHGANFSRPRAS